MLMSVPSLLLGLGLKCVLAWSLVFLQRSHVLHSFLGVFSVSLALVDSVLPLPLTALYLQRDGRLLGLRVTRHHVCLLVQILGRVHSALQWPVALAAGLDHCRTAATRGRPAAPRVQAAVRWGVSALLWTAAVLHVFLGSGFSPLLGDEPPRLLQRCLVLHTPQLPRVAALILLTGGGAALYSLTPDRRAGGAPRSEGPGPRADGATLSRKEAVRRALWTLLRSWALFLAFLAACLLLPAGIPAHLGLNAAWLCFLNSVWIAVARCAGGPAQLFSDSFCDWSLGSERDLNDPDVTPT